MKRNTESIENVKKRKEKQESGITLVTLVVTIIVMMILIFTITASMTTNIELKKYNQVKEDIIALTQEVKVYYMENNVLPADLDKKINLNGVPDKDKNPNDSGKYYPIDVAKLSDLELNCGAGNKEKNYDTDDLYVIDEESLTVYYLKGAVLNGEKHYTIVDDFSGGGFATDYYTKTDLPIISAVTMESNGDSKYIASVGDTITLKILTNYNLTQKPTITINGEDVTNKCSWNGKVGTVEYKVESTIGPDGVDRSGEEVPFKIKDYKVDERTGDEITNVTFGKNILFENVKIKVGDYVNYTYDENNDYMLEAKYSGYTTDQTIPQTKEMKWRVLKIDDNKGTIDLISETAIDTAIYFIGILGYNNGVYLMNDICATQYSNLNLGVTARSINIEDIESNMNETGKAKIKAYVDKNEGIEVPYGGTRTYTNAYYPTLYAQERGSGIETTTVRTDGLDRSDNSTLTEETLVPKADTLTVTQNYCYLYNPREYFADNIFYEMIVEESSNKSYWLASRSIDCYGKHVSFGLRSISNGNFWADRMISTKGADPNIEAYSLRPVVTLKINQLSGKRDENGVWNLK